jgi:hypothetical protein
MPVTIGETTINAGGVGLALTSPFDFVQASTAFPAIFPKAIALTFVVGQLSVVVTHCDSSCILYSKKMARTTLCLTVIIDRFR